MEILIFGLIYSMTLMLMALGFSMTFGISRVANFSIGGLYVLAGYIPWLLIFKAGVPYVLAIAIGLLIVTLLGGAIYWLVLRRVRGSMLAEVISTFAIGIFILESIRGTGLVGFGAKLPKFVSGSVLIGDVMIDYQRLSIVVIGLILIVLIWLFTHRTRLGRGFRAIAQNEETALTMGINSDKVAAMSMMAGAALMAIAAITIIPLGLVHVDDGYSVLVMALTVGIVGGLESTPGIVLASFILGFLQTLAAMYLGSHWVMVVYPVALVIILAVRPSGLLGRSKQLEERV
jgi:branched-chain amino acid transport system permease protein